MSTLKRNLSPLLLSLCAAKAYALAPYSTPGYTQVYTVSGGLGWTDPGKSQTVYTTSPTSIVTYDANRKYSTVGQGEFFLGLQWPFNSCILNQLGIAGGGAGKAKIQGDVVVNGVATGSTYSYQASRGYFGGRWTMLVSPKVFFIQPYVTGAVGAGFNQTSGFTTSPQVDASTSSPFFYNKTNSFALTWSVGAGIEKNLSQNWNIGVGYEFSDWGRTELGRAVTSPWTYNGPKLSGVYVSSLVFNISYLCCA